VKSKPGKILLTGGFGYVGSRLTPHLLQLGWHVRVLDAMICTHAGFYALERNPTFSQWQNRFELIEGDIREPRIVEQAVAGIDAVIHLAAISNDATGEIDEVVTRQVNFDAVGMLLSLARAADVKRFINASSSSVFGIQRAPDVTESFEPEPITFYSRYKMLSEWLVTAAASHDFCTVNIRPATICGYSPRQRFDLTVNRLTADAVRKRLITVHGGQQRRPNVGMADIVNIYAQLLEVDDERINGRTFNFGFENLTVLEIARLIQSELADLNVEIKVTPTVDRRDYHICSEKICRQLPYNAVSSVKQEVVNLRTELDAGKFADVDAAEYSNLESVKLGRNPSCYRFASR
jgi:nucleoside-diphosphate-sugar epimerase